MKNFLQKVAAIPNVSDSDIVAYRKSLIVEMEKIGASDKDLQLVHDATIINFILNKRKPEYVAWAILQ